jgi:hypothetical protein
MVNISTSKKGGFMAAKSRLETLKEKKEKIEQQLKALEASAKAKERKEDTRLKVLIGAGMLADAKIDPSTAFFVKDILKKSIISERDRDFLRRKGWLEDDTAKDKEQPKKGGQ